MIDDSVLWMHAPPTTTKPRTGELVWTLTKGGRTLMCQVRYHGEYGVKVLTLLDGELHTGRRFMMRADALD